MTDRDRRPSRHVIRTSAPEYRFGSMKAADSMQKRKGTARQPSKLPVVSSCGCVFCDLRLTPNISGMHATPDGAVKCTRVR